MPKGTGKTRGNSAAKVDGAMIGEIMAQIMTTMQPMLIKAITVAICTSTKQIITDIIKETNVLNRVIQVQLFVFDKLEQYGLRDTIRVNGIPETGGENTNEIVRAFAADIGVTITTYDISVSHRMP